MADSLGILGLDPDTLKQLMAQFQPSDEDKQRARTAALASAGFGILGARGVNGMQALGQGGLLGVQSYNNDLKDYQAQRMQNLQAVASLSGLMRQQNAMKALQDFANGDQGQPQSSAPQAPAAAPAMAASQGVGGAGMGGGTPTLFGTSSGNLPPTPQPAQPPAAQQAAQPAMPNWRQLAPKGSVQLAAATGDPSKLLELAEKYSAVTMGPDGTVLNAAGQPLYKMTPAGVQRFNPDSSPGQFQAFGADATKAQTDLAAATAGATTAAQEQAKLPTTPMTIPLGNGKTQQVPADIAMQVLRKNAGPLAESNGVIQNAGFGSTPSPQQTAQDTDISKAQGADYASMQAAAKAAPRNIQNLNMLKGLLSNVDTGSTQPISDKFKATVASVFPALANSWAKDVPYSQAASSLISQMQLDLRANMGSLRMTPEDQQNLQNLLALPTNDRRAVPMILDARIANEVTNQKLGDLAYNYRKSNNTFDEGFNPVQADFLSKNPIFPQSAQQPGGAAAPAQAPRSAPSIPPDGTKSTTKDGRPVIVKNGQWRLQ